jgi:hypothetical protein
MSATSGILKTAVANTVVGALEKVAANQGQAWADDTAAGYLYGLQIFLKNTHGPRLAYEAFQAIADDIAETMIAEPR